jgi:hypothetical protein
VRGTGTEHKESHRSLDDKPWSSCVIFGLALALGRFRHGLIRVQAVSLLLKIGVFNTPDN